MKKLFLTLIAIVATSLAGMAQISLSDAYSSLADCSGITKKNIGTVQLLPGVTIDNMTSIISDGNRNAQAFIYAYESLPVTRQLIGVNNRDEMVCAFTQPSDTDVYDVLFLVGQKDGQYIAAYGQTSEAGLEAIRNSEVNLKGESLSMAVTPEVDVVEFIGIEVED